MSIAADTFAVTPEIPAVEAEALPKSRGYTLGKFAVAFAATLLVGSGLRAVAEAGVNQAIDNYYAKQAAAFSEPVPELQAAMTAFPEPTEGTAAVAAE